MNDSTFDARSILATLRHFQFAAPPPRPRLLFSADEAAAIRLRAADHPGLLARIASGADALLKTPAGEASTLVAYVSSAEARIVAHAHFLAPNPAYARWVHERLTAVLALKTWRAPVHGEIVCDHCMGNIAADVALSHDMLGDYFTSAQTDVIADGLRRHILLPFLAATGEKPVWWFDKRTESNWKIMTCGDAGTAFCSFADRWPEAGEALARAAQGVIQTLDAVPPEGDWPEGYQYWFATLMMGLRFARALRRLTGGQADLFQHPVLKATGDFAMMLVTPAGLVYHFNDNVPTVDERTADAVMMLAAESRRGDWMATARKFGASTALYLVCDDPAIASTPSRAKIGFFPRTGVATMRTGWTLDDTFVGFKSGPSDVGHSHLDANSFMVESRGQTLINDYPYWGQAHFLGFFDNAQHRWNFDANATVGHNTLLIDGQGQTWGRDHPGRLREVREVPAPGPAPGGFLAVGDASLAYPGLIKKYVRSILLLAPGVIVIRDVVECEGLRSAEWLLHYAGTIRSQGLVSTIENGGVSLAITPFLPDRSMGWRTSDVTRASVYVNSDTLKEENRSIRYRGFSTFRKAERFEFLFGMRVDGRADGGDWNFLDVAGAWSLRAAGYASTIEAHEDSLQVVAAE